MLTVGVSVSSAATRRRAGGPTPEPGPGPGGPPFPTDAVAVWLVFGQSNAEGWAPWEQDPARSNPANAVRYLTAEERDVHPWLRTSTRGAVPSAGQFPAGGQGIATSSAPRTSSKVWTSGSNGIPAGTPCFGPEIGLVRHVLSGAADEWKDPAAPKLYVFKQTEGGRSVDHFRWGGDGQNLILDALRQPSGENLSSLAASRKVLVQGMIFVIGEKDATDAPPGGGTMADTFAVRFGDWVRQIRAALGLHVPALFVEIHDAIDARKRSANEALAELAGSIPNAAVLHRQPDWSHVGDGIHYDAVGQDRIGSGAFAHFRDAFGRPEDGLVTGFEFSGLKPWFHVPPIFIDDMGTQMKLACVPATTGKLHARITTAGAPQPSAEEIRDRSGEAGGFFKGTSQDTDLVWFTQSGLFVANTTQDCHFVIEGSDGVLGEVVTARRGGNAKFGPDLSLASATGTTATLSVRPTFTGALSWSLHEGARGWMRPEDVEAKAFGPKTAAQLPCTANQVVSIAVADLAPGTTYTMFATGRRTSDGVRSITQRVTFSTA